MVSSKSRSKKSNARVTSSRRQNKFLIWLRRFVLAAIFVTIIAIVVAIVCANTTKPENQVVSRIGSLASDYYEKTFYPNVVGSEHFTGDLEATFGRYSEYGLAPVTLRQLLLNNPDKTAADAEYLAEYCDENRTSVTFYPESPYGATDYRAEYSYSCSY